jgi:hypothetical protein
MADSKREEEAKARLAAFRRKIGPKMLTMEEARELHILRLRAGENVLGTQGVAARIVAMARSKGTPTE